MNWTKCLEKFGILYIFASFVLITYLGQPCQAATSTYPTASTPYQVLDTTHIIAVKIGEAVTTTAPTYAIAYVDTLETSQASGPSYGSFSATYASALAAPAQAMRNITSITLCNIDTVSHTFFVNVAPTGTPATITAALISTYTLAANGTVELGNGGAISSTPLTVPVTVPNGGTGLAALTAGAYLIGNGTGNVALVGPGSTGQIAVSNGSAPVMSTLSGDATLVAGGALTIANLAVTNAKIANTTIDLTAKVTGLLPGTNGGTGTNNGAKTLAFLRNLTLDGTDSTTMTFPATSATIARTDAAQTFVGHNTFEGVTPTGATGTGLMVFGTSPVFITPALGTPASGVITNCTGGPTLTSPTFITPALGTPASGTLTNCTGPAGMITSGTLALNIGGTNANLTASNGGIVYSDASKLQILSAGTSGQIVRSGGAGAPTWTTATFPVTAGTSGNVLTSDGTNWSSSAPTIASPVTIANGGTNSTTALAGGRNIISNATKIIESSGYQNQTGAYTVVTGDNSSIIDVDNSGGGNSITLPTVGGSGIGLGFTVTIRNIGASGTVTITPTAGDGIDNRGSAVADVLNAKYSHVTYVSTGVSGTSAGKGWIVVNAEDYMSISGGPTNTGTTGVFANISTFTLSPGEWDIRVCGIIDGRSATTFTVATVGISSVNGTSNGVGAAGTDTLTWAATVSVATIQLFTLPSFKASVTASQQYWANAAAVFTGTTPQSSLTMTARRFR